MGKRKARIDWDTIRREQLNKVCVRCKIKGIPPYYAYGLLEMLRGMIKYKGIDITKYDKFELAAYMDAFFDEDQRDVYLFLIHLLSDCGFIRPLDAEDAELPLYYAPTALLVSEDLIPKKRRRRRSRASEHHTTQQEVFEDDEAPSTGLVDDSFHRPEFWNAWSDYCNKYDVPDFIQTEILKRFNTLGVDQAIILLRQALDNDNPTLFEDNILEDTK